MATLILKSLASGYGAIFIFFAILGWESSESDGEFLYLFIAPIYFWQATLICSVLAFLIFRAIEERKKRR